MKIGETLQQRYIIQKEIGYPHSRQTFVALDTQTEKLVVVKLLLFNRNLNWESFKLFEREAKTLQALSHPAIPQYIDYFEVESDEGKGFALVQNYIDAPSIEAQIQAGRTFSEDELKQIALAILEILSYLHSQYPPIIHRDIKPSNILLGDRSGYNVGLVYLVDFGSVQACVNKGSTITIVGTYGYMPPEQFGGRTVPASDIYALGATLIYIASGQHPSELPQKELRLNFENSVQLSSSLIRTLRKMTEPSLDLRFQTASEAYAALVSPNLAVETQLTTPTKPFGSKVNLFKDSDVLIIFILSQGFHLGLLPKIMLAIMTNGFSVLWYSIALSSRNSVDWIMALFATFYLYIGLGMIQDILFSLFGQTSLSIDSETISLKYRLFGIDYPFPKPRPSSRITKIERTQINYKPHPKGGRITIHPQIKIWFGDKCFSLGEKGNLSEPELDWLGYELSKWLNLPLVS